MTINEIQRLQFTEETKDQVYNALSGQKVAKFEDDEPVLYFKYKKDQEALIIRFGDWIIKIEDDYYVLPDKVWKAIEAYYSKQ